VAEPVYLFLKVRGAAVEGDSSETSLGRASSIECLSYRQGVAIPRVAGSVAASGRPTYEPLVIRKRIDRATPVLAAALIGNHVVEGLFKFFRPSPSGDGTVEHYYSTEIKDARISAISQAGNGGGEWGGPADHAWEEVAVVFSSISWTWVPGSVQREGAIGDRLFGAGSSQPGSGGGGGGAAPAGGGAGTAAAAASGSAEPVGAAPDALPAAPGPFHPELADRPRASRVDAIPPLT
jgi:type VI secretion system secreted protein Hcp